MARGYIDLVAVTAATKQLALKVSKQRAHSELNAIWRAFTNSFADNEAELRSRFCSVLEEHADKINVSEFAAALDMLTELGVDVDYLVQNYMTLHNKELSEMDPEDVLEARRISYAPLRKQIAELSEKRNNRNIDEVTQRIMINKGWNHGDTEFLASLSELEMRDWMLSGASDLPAKIRGGLLFFGRLTGSSSDDDKRYKQIYDTAVEALRAIGSMSALNKHRIATVYGISEDT
ncbi:MAG: hypothetical protein C0508_17325 [Cyanobacteria bacterium PR.023]|nr:hypothetical protein [Cyanobacteria bacterium PR.023]